MLRRGGIGNASYLFATSYRHRPLRQTLLEIWRTPLPWRLHHHLAGARKQRRFRQRRCFNERKLPGSANPVPVAANQRLRVDDVGEAVAVGVAQEFEIEAVGLAEVRAGAGDDLFAADIADGAFDLDGDAEQPFGIEGPIRNVRGEKIIS